MIGEILFYESMLSDEDMIGLSEFLRKKWISTADLESVRACVLWDGTSIGIEDIAISGTDLSVYPNPLTGNSVLYVPDLKESAVLYLLSVDGSIIEQMPLSTGESFVNLGPWTNPLSSGVYILSLQSSGGDVSVIRIAKP
jgi:hypothetical protein